MSRRSSNSESDATASLSEDDFAPDEKKLYVESPLSSFQKTYTELTAQDVLEGDKKDHEMINAIYAKDQKAVVALLEAGYPLNKYIETGPCLGFTLVVLAIAARSLPLVKLFVDKGADCGKPLLAGTHYGKTPIFIAAYSLYTYSTITDKWSDDYDPTMREILEFLAKQGGAYDLRLECGIFKGFSAKELMERDNLKAALEIFKEEDMRMKKLLNQFRKFFSNENAYVIWWTSLDSLHYVAVKRKDAQLGILKNFLDKMGIGYEKEARKILYIKKSELVAFLYMPEIKKKWAEFYGLRFSATVNALKKEFQSIAPKFNTSDVYLSCDDKTLFILADFLNKARAIDLGDGRFKISLHRLCSESQKDFQSLFNKIHEDRRKLEEFLGLAKECGHSKWELSQDGVKIFFSKYEHERARFNEAVIDFFPRHYTFFSTDRVLGIDEERLNKMLSNARLLKKEDKEKPGKLIDALSCLILDWKISPTTIMTLENLNVERFAVFQYLKKTLELGCRVVGQKVEWDTRDIASLTEDALHLIKKQASSRLAMLHLLFDALQSSNDVKDLCYQDEGFEFSLAEASEAKLKACCAPFRLLESSSKLKGRFLIPYEKILELCPETILTIQKKIDAVKMPVVETPMINSSQQTFFKTVPPPDDLSAKNAPFTKSADFPI